MKNEGVNSGGMKKIVVWFCASENSELVDLVHHFSDTLGSSVFMPHITLLGSVEMEETEDYIQAITSFSKSLSPLKIRLDGIAFDASFWRCFYYLAHHDSLASYHSRLVSTLQSFGAKLDTHFLPHLSLVYSNLTKTKQKAFLQKHQDILSPKSLIFDTIKVIHFVHEDVNAWEELASIRLYA